MLFLLLFNVVFATVLAFDIKRFRENIFIVADLMHLKKPPTSMRPEPSMNYVRCAVWGMLCADDACIGSRSP